MGVQLNKKCPSCESDNWDCIDDMYDYCEFCDNCHKLVFKARKQDYLDNFQCEKCNCLEATLEENKKLIATRCKNCGDQKIVLEKHTTLDHRTAVLNERKSAPTANTKKCPKCGGTEFTPVRKKYSLLTGFITNKVELICNKCGAKIK
ncbi:hypothetical protein [uncultured Robinsoniella sp.]|uniref:hypothetical protein n=1 Tax=uncultured Robinsoniella sp. TaxID=904190 RepID=UPI00204A48F2|nr:MAG TPA: nucleic-acid-binding protein [Caudoviricetes sp.]